MIYIAYFFYLYLMNVLDSHLFLTINKTIRTRKKNCG